MDDHGQITNSDTETAAANDSATSSNHTSIKIERASKLSSFGISESLTDHVNPRTLLTIQQAIILFGLILLLIVALQIPTILYYVNPPSVLSAITSFSDINLDTCSVSDTYY